MRSQRARLRAAVTGAAVVALVAATGPNGAAAPPTAPTGTTGTTTSATPTGVPSGVQAGTQAVGESVLPTTEQLGTNGTGGTRVTLITGDVVSYSPGVKGGKPQVEVTSPRNASFTQVQEGDHYYVYPGDARGLVGAGKLDKMLFDVAYLAKNGYADNETKQLPVIVQYPKSAAAGRSAGPAAAADGKALSAKADALPATTHATGLSVVNSAAVKVDKADATTFWSSVDAPRPNTASLDSGVAKIWLDKKVKASLDVSVPQIGAPEAWAAGYDGTGIKVAVLDTGIDDTHPDLAGKISESKSFVEGEAVKDGHGHGTHVASTIVGSGAASGGKYKGVAPGAELMVGKVLSNAGTGFDSQIIDGMTWAAQSGARIVSMSIGGCCSDGTDPKDQAVNDLSARYGTLFVIAAGNDGGTSTINSPGAADAALTVAAVDKQDQMASFSSRGPRLNNLGLKPDIAAPGVDITAAKADGTALGPVVDDRYTTISGTSMATPHVAGSAAILAQEHPDWSGEKIKEVLVSTSKNLGHGTYDMGAGRVDIPRATTQQVHATGSVAFGRIAAPHTTPASKPLTYVNDGDTPVTLNLTTTATATVPIPDGMFTTNPSTVTVPAHGTATVDVLFNVTKNAPNTVYGGAVHAVSTDGSVTVNTAVGGQKRSRQVKVNLNIINRADMTDAVYFGYSLVRLDDKPGESFIALSGPLQNVSGTVDAGIYGIGNDVTWRDKDGEWNRVLFTNPNVDATGEGEVNVTFDLRKIVQETARTPKDSVPYATGFGYNYLTEGTQSRLLQEFQQPYGATKMWSLPTPEKATRGDFNAYTAYYNGADPVKMTLRGPGGKVALHPQYQSINRNILFNNDPVTMLDGRSTRQIVAVGAGHPADFTGVDLRGKIALLDLSDICPVEPDWYGSLCDPFKGPLDRVQAAKDAGAVAVLGYGSIGRQFLLPLSELNVYATEPTYPIPTMGITANEGRMLAARLAKGPVTVDIDATEWSPYLYPLAWNSHEQLSFGPKTVTDKDLLRTENRVHTDNPGTLSVLTYAPNMLVGGVAVQGASYQTIRTAPFTLTTYAGPLNQDLSWLSLGAGANYNQSRYLHLTRAGSETQNWGEQPLVPNAYRADSANAPYTAHYCYSCRNGDNFLSSRVLTNNGTTTGYIAAGNDANGKPVTEQHLYRADGAEVAPKNGLWLMFLSFFFTPYYDLPAEPADYRITEDFTNPIPDQKWALHVQTDRTFSSQRPTDGIVPDGVWNTGTDCMGWWLNKQNGKGQWELVDPSSPCQATDELYLGYNFGLALDNTLPAESRQNVTITGFGSPYLNTQPKLSTLTLSLSYDDGKTWQKVTAKANRDGTYTGSYTLPKLSKTTGAVTVRAEATDTHGNTVKQTIDRAFGINPAVHGHAAGNAQ